MRRRRGISLPGDAPRGLRVARDVHGVPHVRAPTLAGLLWGLGHCHAMDRGLQLLLMRIAGRGRLSECLGATDEALEADRFFRRLGLYRGLEGVSDSLDPSERHALEAYVAGINARLQRGTPLELRLLRHRPEPWTVGDSVLLSRMIGYVGLAQTQADLERFIVEMAQAGVEEAWLEALFPAAPELRHLGGDDPSLPSRELLARVRLAERMVPSALRWLRLLPAPTASNNWAVAPRRSRSGHALLANDPHLEINRLPNVWYEVVARLDDDSEHYFMGSTMPGLPAPLLGRTREVAWGATYAYADGVDSWIEECRGGRYRRGDQLLAFEERREEIKRKGKPSVYLTFYENPHGVLDGDPNQDGYLLCTRWSASEAGARSLSAMLEMWTAGSAQSASAALGRVETAFNWAFADRQGNIGFQMSGLLPRRRPGVSGLLPLPGWDPDNDWRGFLTPDELPRQQNPECGYVVTANQALNHLGRVPVQNATMPDYRARRIAEVLEENDSVTPADCQALQYDAVSLQARAFMAVLGPLLPDTAQARLLRDWDHRYAWHSRAAALFEAFYRALTRVIIGEHLLGDGVLAHVRDRTPLLGSFFGLVDRILLDPPAELCAGKTRDQLYRDAFAEACRSPSTAWGEALQVRLHNLLLGAGVPAWLGFSRGPLTLEGGRASVNQTQRLRAGGRDTCLGASVRFATDLGEDALYSVLVGGPSDRPWSRWYASEIDAWLSGRYKRLEPA